MLPNHWSTSTEMAMVKRNFKGTRTCQNQRLLSIYIFFLYAFLCITMCNNYIYIYYCNYVLYMYSNATLPRAYPLGFGLQYLSVFEALKDHANQIRKNYQAWNNPPPQPLILIISLSFHTSSCVIRRCHKAERPLRSMQIS